MLLDSFAVALSITAGQIRNSHVQERLEDTAGPNSISRRRYCMAPKPLGKYGARHRCLCWRSPSAALPSWLHPVEHLLAPVELHRHLYGLRDGDLSTVTHLTIGHVVERILTYDQRVGLGLEPRPSASRIRTRLNASHAVEEMWRRNVATRMPSSAIATPFRGIATGRGVGTTGTVSSHTGTHEGLCLHASDLVCDRTSRPNRANSQCPRRSGRQQRCTEAHRTILRWRTLRGSHPGFAMAGHHVGPPDRRSLG